MLKINSDQIKKGTRIRMPEDWHEKVLEFSMEETYPYDFIVDEVIRDKERKKVYCICRTEKKYQKSYKTIFTDHIVRYLLAEEVEDSNAGLSFNEYFPLEETNILITNNRNPSEVVPAVFIVKPELVLIKHLKTRFICLDFEVDFLNGKGFTSINYYVVSKKKFSWKLIDHPDMSFMTDYERMFCDTLIHKNYVEKSCSKLASYLEREGAVEHAILLRERSKVHDNSKMNCEDEMRALSLIINDKSSLNDASMQLSAIKKDALKLHWKHNTHHPEHFKTPMDMSKLDIMEMCCDWHARSVQYGTDFLEFVKIQQENRFHFPDWMFYEIWHYCRVLDSL